MNRMHCVSGLMGQTGSTKLIIRILASSGLVEREMVTSEEMAKGGLPDVGTIELRSE